MIKCNLVLIVFFLIMLVSSEVNAVRANNECLNMFK